jgi:RNA polymerase sigma factor (sigma-70 family)
MTRQQVFDRIAEWVPVLVNQFVGTNPRRLAPHHDDLIQAGLIRAWEIAGEYNPEAAKLTTFALPHLRFALIDFARALRSPYGMRSRQAKNDLAQGRHVPSCLSTDFRPDDQTEHGSSNRDLCGVQVQTTDPEVTDDVGAELVAAVRGTGADLRPGDLKYLTLRFGEGMTLREAGEVLGLCESRVCQIEHRVLGTIREAMLASGKTCFN